MATEGEDRAAEPPAEKTDNKIRVVHTTIEEGLSFVTTKAGDAVHHPRDGDTCKCHYRGQFEDGSVFDSSYDRERPVFFRLGAGQVISGWDKALVRMSRGQIIRLTCEPEFAYGARGYPPIVPPNTKLVFDIELCSFSTGATT